MTHPGAVPKIIGWNTSGNEVINRFIDSVDEPQKLKKDKTELERLVSGNVVRKNELTKRLRIKNYISTIDNLVSTLYDGDICPAGMRGMINVCGW